MSNSLSIKVAAPKRVAIRSATAERRRRNGFGSGKRPAWTRVAIAAGSVASYHLIE
jgi:hypothetical protein